MAIGSPNTFSDLFQRVADGVQSRLASRPGGNGTVKLVAVAEIGLMAALGILLGLIFLTFFAPLSLPDRSAVANAPGPQSSNQALEVKSPFPSSEIAPLAAEDEAPAVAETTLNLKLTGVWANEEGGSATIKLADGTERRFAVGDTIVSGVTLAAVYSDQVTLLRNGAREALKFESKIGASSERPPAPQPNRIVRPASVSRLTSYVRFAPVRNADGEFSIEIYPVRDRRVFANLGLQSGDKLVSINGSPAPRDAAALGNLIREIQQSDRASILVDRNGSQVPITISLDQLEDSNAE